MIIKILLSSTYSYLKCSEIQEIQVSVTDYLGSSLNCVSKRGSSYEELEKAHKIQPTPTQDASYN